MPTSEQLERETKASRERLSRTIDELKARLAPASIADEATAYLRHAVEEPLVADAPPKSSRYALPLALLGAGLAWLAVEARRAEKERERREALARPADALVSEEVAIAEPATVDPDLAAMRRAMQRRDATEAFRGTAGLSEQLPAVPEHGRSLAAVETVSIAPGPLPHEEKQGQRFP